MVVRRHTMSESYIYGIADRACRRVCYNLAGNRT